MASIGKVVFVISALLIVYGFYLRRQSKVDINDFASMAKAVQPRLNRGMHGLEVGLDIASSQRKNRARSKLFLWLGLIGLIGGIITIVK